MRTNKFFVSAALIVLGLASCSKEETMPAERQITLEANIEGCVDTKTSLSGDDATGYQVLWSEGDIISLYIDKDTDREMFTLTQGAGTTKGTFVTNAQIEDGQYRAFYAIDSYWMNARSYYQSANGINSAPMTASVTMKDGVASVTDFKNMCGLLRLTLKGIGTVSEIKVYAQEPLNGKFDINPDGSASIEGSDIDAHYILIHDCGDGVRLTEEGTDFLIPMAPNKYTDVKIEITDFAGNTCTKTLKTDKKLNIARTQITPVSLTINGLEQKIDIPDGALLGTFTVNEKGKTVYFSRGNLYWDGDSYEFEKNQDDHQLSWKETHVDHFYWAKEASAARSKTFVSTGLTSSDALFTNATSETPKSDFTVNGVTGRYRALSADEWRYLFNNHKSKWVTVNGIGGIVIAPDKAVLDDSKNSYSREELASGNLVFLPASGNVLNGEYGEVGSQGEYWSSTANTTAETDGKAYCIHFRYNGFEFYPNYHSLKHCTSGLSIRLVAESN